MSSDSQAQSSSTGCPVCTERTTDSKFCRGCAVFYARNKSATELPCLKSDYNCQITPANRRCRGCRLRKCLSNLSEDSKENSPVLKRTSSEAAATDGDVKRSKSQETEEGAPAGPAPGPAPGPSAAPEAGPPSGPPPAAAPTGPPPPQQAPAAAPKPDRHGDALKVLGMVLPATALYAYSLNSNKQRSSLLKFALSSAESNHVKWASRFFANHPGFIHLNRASKEVLMRQSFFLDHILDAAWSVFDGKVEKEFVLSDRTKKASTTELAVFGNPNAVETFSAMIAHLRSIQFNKCDYCLFRQLALFDSMLMDNDAVYRQHHMGFLNAWKFTRQLDEEQCKKMMRTFSGFVFLAKLNRNYLTKQYFLGQLTHTANPLIMSAVAPRRL